VLEVARLVLRLTNSRSRIEMRPLPQDDPRRRRPEIAYAADVLRWSPSTGFEEGLGRTIDFFRRQLALNGSSPTFARGSHGMTIALRPRQGRRAVAESLD
jgi:UDP-glucuronate decarboxylase